MGKNTEPADYYRSEPKFDKVAYQVYYQGMYWIYNPDNNSEELVIKFDNYKAKCFIDIRLSKDLRYVGVLYDGKYIKYKVSEVSRKPIKGSKYKGKINTYKHLKQSMIELQNNLNNFISKTKNEFINRKENIHE